MHNESLLDTFFAAPLPVKLVVIVLLLQAVLSLIVTFERAIMLLRSRGASQAFAAKAGPLMKNGDWAKLFDVASKAKGSHLADLMFAGLKTFIDRSNAGDDNRRAAEMARRSIARRGESMSTSLNRGMVVLASTGSTAPFVGLLGTVLGILFAFQMIAETGAGGIGTIGGAIGEALIVTGLGLVVAIPVVILYNWLNGWIANFELGLTNAAGELVDLMEVSEPGGPAQSAYRNAPEPGDAAEAAEPSDG